MPDISSSSASAARITRISEQRLHELLFLLLCRPDRVAAIAWWRLLGKKQRARGQMELAIARLPFAIERWAGRAGQEDRAVIAAERKSGEVAKFCVHLHVGRGDSPQDVSRALRSLRSQSTAPHRVFVTCEDADFEPANGAEVETIIGAPIGSRIEGLGMALESARDIGADWLVPIKPSARLPRHALSAYAAYIRRVADSSQTALLYGDEAEIGRFGLSDKFWLKPEWDRRMALSQDYITGAFALAVAPALATLQGKEVPVPQGLYELVLRLSESWQVHHVKRITARTAKDSWQSRGPESAAAVARVIGKDMAEVAAGTFGTVELRWHLPDPAPLVSVIVATRDRVELLRTCVEGVLHQTDYPALELIVADNESVETETLAYLEEVATDPRATVVRWPHPFNYSAINNFAASHARGDYLCLLNNDIEVLQPDWLSALVREAVQPGIGAVGARLLYPDRTIQHAGVAIGIGRAAGHAHRGLPESEAGYFAQAYIARGASAVTGACLLVARQDFEAVGGLDEKELAVAYNDVDLCLKLRERGLANIYAPAATLIHHESKSRGLDFAPEHLERYRRELKVLQQRWNTAQFVDPWHHSKLDGGSETYRVGPR